LAAVPLGVTPKAGAGGAGAVVAGAGWARGPRVECVVVSAASRSLERGPLTVDRVLR